MPSVASNQGSGVAWVESLSPWPEKFGLDTMRALLAELGDPQLAYPSIHVVGTKGKSTATRTIAAYLERGGLRTGAYTSPHVSGWGERIQVGAQEVDIERALERVRPAAEALGATQFEALTAAALLEFCESEVDVAVVEAGLGGRLDATNVIDAGVVLLTNVDLEHTEVLGETREQIAKEKLAIAHVARVVVTSDNTYANLIPEQAEQVLGGPRAAAAAFLGWPLEGRIDPDLPGRFEQRGEEVWDGAHTPAAVDWLLERLPASQYTICVSVLGDKDVDAILERLARAGDHLIATRSSNERALPADELAGRAEPHFARVEAVADPRAAYARARELGPRVLVTGSLYLLADLYR
ncbi:MAG: bifunctional folylpolyglutamate synthase/dihydrofolate synthase [Gaiellaceae bacterium]